MTRKKPLPIKNLIGRGRLYRPYLPKGSILQLNPNGKAVGSDTIREAVCISGDPEVHVAYARRYIDAGFNLDLSFSRARTKARFWKAMAVTSCRG